MDAAGANLTKSKLDSNSWKLVGLLWNSNMDFVALFQTELGSLWHLC